MTKDETRAMLTIITANYPQAFRGISRENMRVVAATWHEVFGEYDPGLVRHALTECMTTSVYPPGIADILEKIKIMTQDTSDEDDWKTACAMIHTGNWLTKEEWLEAPEHVRRWFGSMSAVKELSNQSDDTLQTVTRGQFMRSIGTLRERCRMQKEMPDEIRRLAEQLRLESGNDHQNSRHTAKHEQVQRTGEFLGVSE